MLKNPFYAEVKKAEDLGATEQDLKQLLGRSRAKRGMFEGRLDEGELEIGQVSALLKDIRPAATIVKEIWDEFENALQEPLSHE